MLEPAPYVGPIVVTLAYIGLYYLFQVYVLRVKSRLQREYKARNETFDRYFGQDRQMLAADRVQLNMLEHMPPFLVLLWLNAAFVDPASATVAGGVYVGARAIYPLALGPRLGRGIRAAVLLSTVPGYLVLGWFSGALLWALFG
jgi:MAPEG family